MKLSIRTLIYLGFLFALIATGLAVTRVNQENLLSNIFQENSDQRKKVFKTIFELKESQTETLSVDYTYWDEMVNFVASKDLTFAQENLDTSLSTYNTDAIWVYDTSDSLVYSVRRQGDGLKVGDELEVDIPKRQGLFRDGVWRVHFFLKSEQGIYDVFAATIHPSNDPERQTEPKGYLFAGKLLSSGLLSDIEKATNAKVSILSSSSGDLGEKKSVKTGKLIFYQELIGVDKKPIAYLKITNEFGTVKHLATTSDRDFLILFALAVGFFAASFLVIYLQDRSVERAMRIAEVMTANLTESEARFRAMNDASPFGIFVTDPKGKCIYTNTAYQKLTGQTSEQSWGDGWIETVHPDDRQRVYVEWYSSAQAGGNYYSEHRIQKSADQIVWVQVKADGIRVEDKLLGFVGVVEDVTENKKNLEVVEKQNQEIAKLKKLLEQKKPEVVKLTKVASKSKGKQNIDLKVV